MNRFIKYFTILFTAAALAACGNKDDDGPGFVIPEYPETGTGQEPLNITATEIAADMFAGINIGNTMEAINNGVPSETAWGNPKVNEKYIQGLKMAD